MIRICARATFRSSTTLKCHQIPAQRFFSCTQWRREDPRLDDSGRKITDEFAEMREKYGKLCSPRFILKEANSC
jgi:triacylglycerol lipase